MVGILFPCKNKNSYNVHSREPHIIYYIAKDVPDGRKQIGYRKQRAGRRMYKTDTVQCGKNHRGETFGHRISADDIGLPGACAD
jgi:hypothetical protein